MSALFRRKSSKTPPPEPPPELPDILTDAAGSDGSATVYVTGDRAKDTDRIRMLVDSLQEVSTADDPTTLLDAMVDRAVKTVGAERGLLFVADEEGRPVLRVGRDAKGNDLPRSVAFSTQVVTSVFGGGDSICQKTDDSGDFDPSQSMLNLAIRAVMCVPLMAQEERLGVMYVDQRASTLSFDKADLRFFQAFADIMAIAWMNRRRMEQAVEQKRLEQDLDIARTIQTNLLPEKPLRVDGYSLVGRVIPADATGGDYFDFFKTRDDHLAMAVGDVSGHGSGAALVMAAARAYVRSFSQFESSPGIVMRRVNRHLAEDTQDHVFMSMFLCILDPNTREFHYVNAGHPGPILMHANGETEDFKGTGIALAVTDEVDYDDNGPWKLDPGDTVIMFSDGLTELRRDDEWYGRERVLESVRKHSGGTAEDMLEGMFKDALAWGRHEPEHADDLTIAILRADV